MALVKNESVLGRSSQTKFQVAACVPEGSGFFHNSPDTFMAS